MAGLTRPWGVTTLNDTTMSKREGPDQPATPGSASGSASDALTSGDIFGEILDEVGGERLDPDEEERRPSGRGPIKVQVSEPDPEARSASRAAAAPGARKGVKELRPEDVATLLDVFSAAEDDGFPLEAPLSAADFGAPDEEAAEPEPPAVGEEPLVEEA